MFPIQSLGVESEVCLSHAGGSKVTKPILSSGKRYCISRRRLHSKWLTAIRHLAWSCYLKTRLHLLRPFLKPIYLNSILLWIPPSGNVCLDTNSFLFLSSLHCLLAKGEGGVKKIMKAAAWLIFTVRISFFVCIQSSTSGMHIKNEN